MWVGFIFKLSLAQGAYLLHKVNPSETSGLHQDEKR